MSSEAHPRKRQRCSSDEHYAAVISGLHSSWTEKYLERMIHVAMTKKNMILLRVISMFPKEI